MSTITYPGLLRPGPPRPSGLRVASPVSRARDARHALVHHGVGMTDVVKRATPRADELTTDEYRAGMLRLGLDKIQDWSVVPAWLAPLNQNSEIVLRETRRAMQDNTLVAQPQQLRVVGSQRRQRRFAQASL